MAKAVGLVLALVALAAGILCAVDATTCLLRASLAFVAGWVGATVWQGVFIATTRIPFVNIQSGESYNDVPNAGDARSG